METSLLWLDAVRLPRFPQLARNLVVDVVVVGGGIAGTSIAWELSRRGSAVTLFEQANLGAGASGRNTGTLLRLRAAPISRFTILSGKSFACALTCLVDLTLLSLLGWLAFGVQISDPLKYVVVLLACTTCFNRCLPSSAGC